MSVINIINLYVILDICRVFPDLCRTWKIKLFKTIVVENLKLFTSF